MITLYEALQDASDLIEAEDAGVAKEQIDNVLLFLQHKYPLEYSFKKAMVEVEMKENPPLCSHCNGSGEGRASDTACSQCGGEGIDYNLINKLINEA